MYYDAGDKSCFIQKKSNQQDDIITAFDYLMHTEHPRRVTANGLLPTLVYTLKTFTTVTKFNRPNPTQNPKFKPTNANGTVKWNFYIWSTIDSDLEACACETIAAWKYPLTSIIRTLDYSGYICK